MKEKNLFPLKSQEEGTGITPSIPHFIYNIYSQNIKHLRIDVNKNLGTWRLNKDEHEQFY
jgi:hypothetical protein